MDKTVRTVRKAIGGSWRQDKMRFKSFVKKFINNAFGIVFDELNTENAPALFFIAFPDTKLFKSFLSFVNIKKSIKIYKLIFIDLLDSSYFFLT